ncbi:hypothetical protein G6F32_017391 [Rhizopus arrhizus]|nr:hypothetical protein G6F32_017391 [Rhizopus arrhizus]
MATISACALGSCEAMLRFQPSPSSWPSAPTSTAPTGISSNSRCARSASASAWRIQCSSASCTGTPRVSVMAVLAALLGQDGRRGDSVRPGSCRRR